MNFRKYLEKTGKKLDREVGGILKEELKKAGKTDKKLVPLLTAFTESCQGGKGIRGGLVVLGYEIARGGDHLGGVMASQAQPATIRGDLGEKGIIKVAAAYEILHSAILVHDDIIDQSLERRNEPSLYQVLGGNHYGTSQAISLADYGFFLSFKLISESDFPSERKISALKLFSRVMMDTSLGEMLDLEKTDP
ncbi:MAG: polyprenyl synthetase family protein, partial [Candidatus Daviesbacteria bacterium]|nr:polyprenyl synthetase family protein [Candidatus Daviesbacteria bacterium]